MTQEFLQTLRATKQDTMEAWAQEGFPGELQNAAALGGIRVVEQAINLIEGYTNLEDDLAGIERVN